MKTRAHPRTVWESGIAGIGILFLIIILFLLLYGADIGYIGYTKQCGDTSPAECFAAPTTTPSALQPTPFATPLPPIRATGQFSYKTYTVYVTMLIPPDGGAVSGSVSGTCDGTVRGTYDKGSNALSGSMFGSCTAVIFPVPARADFTGTLNGQSRTVPVNAEGEVAGMSGNGNVTLTF